jgi:16S rRNA (cytosine1402-N4)-methyltransferase
MLDSVVEALAPALQEPGSVYVDGTLGLAGHAAAILSACPEARLIGIDRDPHALSRARTRLAGFGDRVTCVEAVFDDLERVLDDRGTPRVEAVLLDLGLSSLQIDDLDRGFSYSQDAPLDMRMSPGEDLTAADIVNTYAHADIARILRVYGEERFADRIATRIVAARQKNPFTRTGQVVDVVASAIPMAARASGGHPAKRTFQALRIEVNRELDVLAAVLDQALTAVAVGGRVAVLSYHSLEDRAVKRAFRDRVEVQVPPHLPVVPEHMAPRFRLVTHGAQRPTPSEIEANPRAASARFRVAERIREDA